MASSRDLALGLGLGLEATAAAALVGGAGALAIGAHVAAAAAIGLGLVPRLPAGGARLACAFVGFLPVAGAIGAVITALVSPRKAAPRTPAVVRTPVPGPELARVHAARPSASAPTTPAARIAVARRGDGPESIAVLRRALGDPDEDVRLVAHAALESRQRAASRRVNDAARELAVAPPARRAARERQLAAESWELARAGVADGDCLVHALDSARDRAQAAVAADPDRPSSWLILGRVELRRGDATAAETALARAIEHGLAPATVAPYLAEAAFVARRFARTRALLAGATHPALARIARYWS